MSLIVIFILAVGLSMDAFSLSLIYGTLNLPKKMQKTMSIMVGIFHFFMPLLGYQIGELILKVIKINPDIFVGIIFIILAIQMLLSLKKEQINDASWLIIQAGKLKREIFKECSEHYKKTYDEEVKSAANLDALNNNPL